MVLVNGAGVGGHLNVDGQPTLPTPDLGSHAAPAQQRPNFNRVNYGVRGVWGYAAAGAASRHTE